MTRALAALALATAALSGCTGEDASDPLSATSFSLTLTDVPATVAANATFTVTLTALSLGNLAHSDHVGAHVWAGGVGLDPTAELGRAVTCEHLAGGATLPGGPYVVTCTAPAATGWLDVRGHARIMDEAGVQWDWWSTGQDSVQVVAA